MRIRKNRQVLRSRYMVSKTKNSKLDPANQPTESEDGRLVTRDHGRVGEGVGVRNRNRNRNSEAYTQAGRWSHQYRIIVHPPLRVTPDGQLSHRVHHCMVITVLPACTIADAPGRGRYGSRKKPCLARIIGCTPDQQTGTTRTCASLQYFFAMEKIVGPATTGLMCQCGPSYCDSKLQRVCA